VLGFYDEKMLEPVLLNEPPSPLEEIVYLRYAFSFLGCVYGTPFETDFFFFSDMDFTA
jgi:hypothetical protein